MPTANPYLPIATPDRTTAAWILVEHVSPSLASSIEAPTLAAIRSFVAEASATDFFVDTITQEGFNYATSGAGTGLLTEERLQPGGVRGAQERPLISAECGVGAT